MTDLHTHILPGMDDGPKTLADAMALVERAAIQGVDHIALTSHFHCENESVEAYLARREIAFSALREVCPRELSLKRGCEVYFSPRLLTENVEALCLEGTKVLLLELPVLQKPAFLREVLTALSQKGITPLIAHVERYQYVAQDPRILAVWVELGALIQVNAQSKDTTLRQPEPSSEPHSKASRNEARLCMQQIPFLSPYSFKARNPETFWASGKGRERPHGRKKGRRH